MALFRSGARLDGDPAIASDRILTVPNVLSLLRLAGLPFVYVDIVAGRELRALIILFVISWSDFIDGYVARRFDQVSRLGQLFDPISDRILMVTVAIAMVVADIVPLWAVLLLVARDVFVLVGGAILVARGAPPPPVTDLGKATTFGLMTALPLFIVARGLESAQLRGSAWMVLIVFTALYYVAAAQYVVVALRAVRSPDTAPA